MAEQKKNEMQTNITQLRQACEELESEVTRLDQEIIDIVQKDEDDNKREEKAHLDQVDYLKALNQDYKSELEQLLSTTNKSWAQLYFSLTIKKFAYMLKSITWIHWVNC